MPRNLSNIWNYFQTTTDNGKKRAICNFCESSYVLPNATRLKLHLASCKQCPFDVKERIKEVKKSEMSKIKTSMCNSFNSPGTSSAIGNTCIVNPPETSSENAISDKNASIATTSTITAPEIVTILGSAGKEEIDAALARAVYATGAPLSMFESPYWRNAFSLIYPGYQSPNRHALTKPLLEAEYLRVKKLTQEKISNAVTLGLITDSWTNICGRGVLNFLITTPEPVFYKSVYPGINRETAQFISTEICKIVEDIGPHKFTAVITDNASNMKAAWKDINSKYSSIACIGCAAHCLHLLNNDVMKIGHLQSTFMLAKSIVKYIRGKHVVLAIFEEKQKEKNEGSPQSLKIPSNTRWGFSVSTFNSLLANREVLETTVLSQDTKIDPQIKRAVLDDDNWLKIKEARDILFPIFTSIKKAEADTALLSDVPSLFEDIMDNIRPLLLNSAKLETGDKKKIEELIADRRKFCLQPVHYAAHLLDPRFKGLFLKEDEFLSAAEYISSVSTTLNLDVAQVVADLAEYRTQSGFWSKSVLWAPVQLLKPRLWWQGLCFKKTISLIAVRLLSVPPTSAASERNWSLFGRIHSKARNRLTPDKLDKLVMISSNLQFLQSENSISTLLNGESSSDCDSNESNTQINYDPISD